ncbi:MAG: helix-turn-helix domain-containing protein [Lachnospiraceae bacterium]|nr:helix-turn-helix domain-containing protein [Lachnospiraceae bacterium]
MTIGEEIKRTRKKVGLSQKELGERLNVSQSMIAQYENGKRMPKIETLQKIADALEVELWEMVELNQMDLDTRILEIKKMMAQLSPEGLKEFDRLVTESLNENQESSQKEPEEAAKNAPKFVTYDEKGNKIECETAPKFTDISRSQEEARARYEIEVLFNTILDEGNLSSVREKNIAQLHEILTSYSNLNEIGKEMAVAKIRELGYSSATTDSQLDDIYFNRVMKKINNGEDLTQAEIEWRYAYLDKSLKTIGNDFGTFYSMLNRKGQETAWIQINRTIEQIELLTKIPEYQKEPDDPPQD